MSRDILHTVVKNPSNIELLEKYASYSCDSEEEYLDRVYFAVGNITRNQKKLSKSESIKETLGLLYNKLTGWSNPMYDKYRQNEQEQIEFLSEPPQVEEGILKCGKCKSERTVSFAKQMRSADEPMSVFAQCVECGNKWREN